MTAPQYVEETFIAPVNIAVIKYWGKRDTQLILPTNSSLSVTLNTDDLHSKTTIRADASYTEDTFVLNGKDDQLSLRMSHILKELRSLSTVQAANWKLKIVSVNNFPTAAGLASSASGLACFVVTLAKLLEVQTDLSRFARQGSGSACRSVYGGYVKWEIGSQVDGSDSIAVQVAPASHWPQMRAFILVVNDKKKDISSTFGMQSTVETSQLFKYRVSHVVDRNMKLVEQGIMERDFGKFALGTMADSNSFHAVCLDTQPPIFYLNDTSRDIINWVHKFNKIQNQIKVAYTFDAGPNAVLYFLEENAFLVAEGLSRRLDFSMVDTSSVKDFQVLNQLIKAHEGTQLKEGHVKRVIYTSVGEGPRKVDESLLQVDGSLK